MKCYFNLELLAKRWKYVQRRKMCEMAIMHKYFSQNDQQSLWADKYLHTKHVHSICFTNFPLLISFLGDNIQRIWREVVRAESEQPWMSIALSAITALPREGWNLFSSTMMLINLKYHWNYNMVKNEIKISSPAKLFPHSSMCALRVNVRPFHSYENLWSDVFAGLLNFFPVQNT